MTGSVADAEDLAQETFIQAFRQIAEYRGEAAFSSWLCRIAINRCLNWRKREQRRGLLDQEWGKTQSGSSAEEDGQAGAVQAALMKLPSKQRAAVVLTVYEGRSHAEAARALGCAETTVSWRVFAARQKLRRWLRPSSAGKAGDE